MKRMIIVGLFCALCMTLSPAKLVADEQKIVLIGHAMIPDSLTQEEVKQIFLSRKTRWNDDTKITFFSLNNLCHEVTKSRSHEV